MAKIQPPKQTPVPAPEEPRIVAAAMTAVSHGISGDRNLAAVLQEAATKAVEQAIADGVSVYDAIKMDEYRTRAMEDAKQKYYGG